MKKLYLLFILISALQLSVTAAKGSLFLIMKVAGQDSTKLKPLLKNQSKSIDSHLNKASLLKSDLHFKFVPFQPFNLTLLTTNAADIKAINGQDENKVLSNVKVYPNPVSDQLNLTYHVNKDSNVTIKIMDVLGNEITTLFNQRQAAGEQTNTFNLSSRLNSGFYFIRLVVGSEIIVKRISIL